MNIGEREAKIPLLGGSNLEVSDAIRRYMEMSNGDVRLALAYSVGDAMALMRAMPTMAGRARAMSMSGSSAARI